MLAKKEGQGESSEKFVFSMRTRNVTSPIMNQNVGDIFSTSRDNDGDKAWAGSRERVKHKHMRMHMYMHMHIGRFSLV